MSKVLGNVLASGVQFLGIKHQGENTNNEGFDE